MTSRRSIAILLMLFSCCASKGLAQSTSGAIVGGTVGVAIVDSESDFDVTASAGYRFNRAFSLGVELTMMPSMSQDVPDYYPLIRIDSAGGSITAFTTNVRLEIPTTPARIIPYVVMGGGVANVKQSADVIIQGVVPADVVIGTSRLASLIYPLPDVRTPFTVSTTDLALTVGGGVSILAVGNMTIDVDLRYLHLLGDEDQSIGRFGAGVSYRF